MSKIIVKDLDTLHKVYEPDGKTPEMLGETDSWHTLVKGEEVEVTDGRGNSVRCTVGRKFVAVVPDWETYNNGAAPCQESML